MATESGKVHLPFPSSAKPKDLVSTCTAQSGTIKQCPLYTSTPAVQTVVTDMDTAVSNLGVTLGKIDVVHAQLSTLETTRDTQIVTVRLKHDAVESALNVSSNGDPQVAEAWVGKTKTRAKPVEVTASTDPPENPALAVIKSRSGAVKASCKIEPGAVCYLFQRGTDPAHPETWPSPVFSTGNTFTLSNLPVGQTVYLRIAVVRRGSVQGQWSAILQVVVR